MSVYIQHECAVCVRVMFSNHYNNFLAYTSQIWPHERGIPNPMSLSLILTEVTCKKITKSSG